MEKKYIIEQGDGIRQSYEFTECLMSGKSEFQKVEVYQTPKYGRMLWNDDLVMISEKDEFVYHDMISHVPLFTHPSPKKVLVIGGGDGGTAREVLRHKLVEKCDMVEIDALVVEACRKFIPQTACGMEPNPRFELFIEDGVEFVKNTTEKYDVVIVDSTDPIGPATPLFGPEFYANVWKCLGDKGVVVSQGESVFHNNEMQVKLGSILNQSFPIVRFYNYSNLTYPGGLWSFSWASKGLDPIKDFDRQRVLDSGIEFQYYTADLHVSSFDLPAFQLRSLAPYLK